MGAKDLNNIGLTTTTLTININNVEVSGGSTGCVPPQLPMLCTTGTPGVVQGHGWPVWSGIAPPAVRLRPTGGA